MLATKHTIEIACNWFLIIRESMAEHANRPAYTDQTVGAPMLIVSLFSLLTFSADFFVFLISVLQNRLFLGRDRCQLKVTHWVVSDGSWFKPVIFRWNRYSLEESIIVGHNISLSATWDDCHRYTALRITFQSLIYLITRPDSSLSISTPNKCSAGWDQIANIHTKLFPLRLRLAECRIKYPPTHQPEMIVEKYGWLVVIKYTITKDILTFFTGPYRIFSKTSFSIGLIQLLSMGSSSHASFKFLNVTV